LPSRRLPSRPSRRHFRKGRFAFWSWTRRGSATHTRTIRAIAAHDASYLITSEWSDEQAFRDFIQSQAFKDVTNWGKEQILSGRPQHKIYKH
jgi:heme-degrading monooxygenase HmoA